MKKGSRLYLFNPERDFALGHGLHYTISEKVNAMRRHLSLLPAVYARSGSIILIDEDLFESLPHLPDYSSLEAKNITPMCISQLKDMEVEEVVPWGWCEDLCHRLIKSGIRCDNLPDDEKLRNIRKLSHRRNTIRFHQILRDNGFSEVEIPLEFNNYKEAFEWGMLYKGAYFKSPWSSSGRGAFRSGIEPEDRFLARIQSVIRAQGSILAEVGERRKIDCATEWMMRDGKANYLGLSVFKTRPSGGYIRNVEGSQDGLKNILESCCSFGNRLIEAQRKAIEEIYQEYEGALGVDMLVTEDGRLNPCVEVNTRITMGHVQLARTEGLII